MRELITSGKLAGKKFNQENSEYNLDKFFLKEHLLQFPEEFREAVDSLVKNEEVKVIKGSNGRFSFKVVENNTKYPVTIAKEKYNAKLTGSCTCIEENYPFCKHKIAPVYGNLSKDGSKLKSGINTLQNIYDHGEFLKMLDEDDAVVIKELGALDYDDMENFIREKMPAASQKLNRFNGEFDFFEESNFNDLKVFSVYYLEIIEPGNEFDKRQKVLYFG